MTRVATWQNQGTAVNGLKNLDEVLKAANLDYEVTKLPLYYNIDGKQIPTKQVATVRVDQPSTMFGIVSPGYEILQNRDAFDFVNCIDEDIEFVKAGQTNSGIVYIIGQLPKINVLGDDVRPHLIFQTGHNGYTPVKANLNILRIVCQNQFNYSFKDAANAIRIRHSATMNERLLVAKDTIQRTREYVENYKGMADQFARTKVTDRVLQNIIKEMIGDTDEIVERKGRRIDSINERVSLFQNAYKDEDNQNFKGTAWGIINAWSDYTTHLPAMKSSASYEENRFIQVTFENKQINKLVGLLEAAR